MEILSSHSMSLAELGHSSRLERVGLDYQNFEDLEGIFFKCTRTRGNIRKEAVEYPTEIGTINATFFSCTAR